MEAHLALTQPTQVKKVTTSCEICSGPHDTQYFMEDPKQAFVEYASSCIDEEGEVHGSINVVTICHEQQSDPQDGRAKENEEEEEDKPENIHFDSSTPPDTSLLFITKKVLNFNSFFESLGLVPPSSNTELICTKEEDGDVMFSEIVLKDDNSRKEEPEAGEHEVEHFDMFPTRSELTYHKYLMYGPIPLIFLQNPTIMEICPSNLKIPCNIGHIHVEKAYIDPNSPLNIMTQMMYYWIMRRKLDLGENSNGGVSNFTGNIKGVHVFIGNFTYIVDFMIVENISSIIDPRLSQVVLGRSFVEISNMTYDPPEGVVVMQHFAQENNIRMSAGNFSSKTKYEFSQNVETASRFTRDAVTTTSVTGLYLMRRSLEVLRKFHWMILGG
ncbi:hypothetical protein Tco_0922839 [Tanacetum coccineum]|uniref:MAK10-like protein n=1 Tax=Tanacetum coccineum TaxID=301880 RepID=A0ABQ5CZ99_9ASTR